MASEKAKELAAKQRAEAKAAKERKKNSTNPADWGVIRQYRESYKMAAEHDKRTPWVVFGSFAACVALGVVLGIVFDLLIMGILIGILLGITAAAFLLMNLVKSASYNRYDGQAGSGQVPLMMLNRKKWTYTPAVAGDRSGTMVHRAVGPAGLLLLGEGNPTKAKMLLASERKRHEQVLYGVEVTPILMGDEEGAVPLRQVTKYINKLPNKLNKVQIADIESRLKALDAMRQKAPIPRGPMPSTRGVRRAMRGR